MKLNDQILIEKKEKIKKIFLYILNKVNKRCVEAEIIIDTLIGIKVNTRYGKLENIEFINSNNFKIIIYQNGCMGSASSANLNEKFIDKTIDAAINISKYTSKDDCFGIADDELLAYNSPDLKLFYDFNINVKQAFDMAKISELSAFETDKKIKNTEGSSFSSYFEIKTLGNTKNMLETYCSSNHVLSTCVIAEKNKSMERDYFYSISRNLNELMSPQKVGQKAAKRAIARLLPSKLSTMKTPVIFSAETATSLFKHLAEAINGFNIYNKSSCLINYLQKQVFPLWLSIKENPHIISGLASAPFDQEGVLTKSIEIINNGILKNLLLTNYSARKLGLKNNGHAGGIYNWIFLCKKINFKELIKNMYNGLLITEIMGNGVNIITGDYSRGASGFWVENGLISFPVSEITISGNLINMWQNIKSMSDDIEKRSSIQCGSVLLSEMCVSGR